MTQRRKHKSVYSASSTCTEELNCKCKWRAGVLTPEHMYTVDLPGGQQYLK